MTKKVVDKDLSNLKDLYIRINKEIDNLDKKDASNIPGEIKSDTNDLESRIGKVEHDTGSIKRLLGICIVMLVVSIITITIDIFKDRGLSSQFQENEIRILNTLKEYEYKVIEIDTKQNLIENYIDEKIENQINKALLECYRNNNATN